MAANTHETTVGGYPYSDGELRAMQHDKLKQSDWMNHYREQLNKQNLTNESPIGLTVPGIPGTVTLPYRVFNTIQETVRQDLLTVELASGFDPCDPASVADSFRYSASYADADYRQYLGAQLQRFQIRRHPEEQIVFDLGKPNEEKLRPEEKEKLFAVGKKYFLTEAEQLDPESLAITQELFRRQPLDVASGEKIDVGKFYPDDDASEAANARRHTLFLNRLVKLVKKAEQHRKYLPPTDRTYQRTNRAIESTYNDAIALGLGEEARTILQSLLPEATEDSSPVQVTR